MGYDKAYFGTDTPRRTAIVLTVNSLFLYMLLGLLYGSLTGLNCYSIARARKTIRNYLIPHVISEVLTSLTSQTWKHLAATTMTL